MPSVLIADCDHGSLEPERELLEAAGVELRVGGGGDADVLIVQYATVDGALLDRMPRCRAVVRYGVGVDTIDLEAATARGVWVVNVPDYGTEEVADHAIALMLALLRGVVVLDRSVRAGDWADRAAGELRATGRTVRRRGVGPVEQLTPQERQTAQAVAAGRTTREAAAALFLSPKTVEFHLRNVYIKLGIHSREDLVRAMAEGV